MNITYRKFRFEDRSTLSELMESLAKEDSEGKIVTLDKINKTFEELSNHPDKGTIMVICDESEIIGYSILIFFWSNEYGGNFVDIDELYIKPSFRNQGIGTSFIKFLIETRFNNAVAFQLETMPSNFKAKKLYETIGFKDSITNYLVYDLENNE